MKRRCWVVACLWASAATAQYKVVGPDGSVTYTDRPGVASGSTVTPLSPGGIARPASSASAPTPTSALPFELRQVAERFPVTLYSTPDCAPCERGRRLLQQRGIPFAERQVQTNEDQDALERIASTRTVPVLGVGAQFSRGWLESEWTSVLDLAGYPAQSRLPRDWQPPPVTSLAPPRAEPAQRPPPAAPAAPPPTPPAAEPGPVPTLRF